jgi:prepilin-type N-terminal cleavage/methylation domain-containing protein
MTRSTRQTTWWAGTHEQRLCVMSNHASALPQRSGFTLVELLVVITIIAVLAALITPAVFQARRSGQISAIKAEIDLLHMAMMHYKNEYGSFPPCANLAAAQSHVLRLFPRTVNISSEVDTAPTLQTSLYYWLEGYTKNPTSPVKTGDPVKLFEFDRSRLTTTYQYHPVDKPNSPYLYINNSSYNAFSAGAPGSTTLGANRRTATEYFNPDTFQILCAGLDEEWGTDDDLSNFWKGTRGDQ